MRPRSAFQTGDIPPEHRHARHAKVQNPQRQNVQELRAQPFLVDDDDDGTRIQLTELAVVAKVKAHGVQPGDAMRVKLVAVDTTKRTVQFERVS